MYGIHSMGTTRFSARIDGEVDATEYGVISAAATLRVTVGRHGDVDGDVYGIFRVGADGGTVMNHGSISSTVGRAVHFAQPGGELRNSGDITGAYGVSMVGSGLIVNGKDGLIAGFIYGIVADANAGDKLKIVNHGTIIGSDAGQAIRTEDGDDRIISDGRILGGIWLGDGKDLIDLRHGSAKGELHGGFGDDTLITDKAAHKLVENPGEGLDTVQSTVSYKLSPEVEQLFLLGGKDIDGTGTATANTLRGNFGDNILKGLAGADHLHGNKGNDRLFGGADGDIFHFSSGNGRDRIMDFETGLDAIDLSGWKAVNNFTRLLDHARNDGDGNVVITAGKDSLTIMDMVKADLDINDFIF